MLCYLSHTIAGKSALPFIRITSADAVGMNRQVPTPASPSELPILCEWRTRCLSRQVCKIFSQMHVHDSVCTVKCWQTVQIDLRALAMPCSDDRRLERMRPVLNLFKWSGMCLFHHVTQVNDANCEQWDFSTKAPLNSCRFYPASALHSFPKSKSLRPLP